MCFFLIADIMMDSNVQKIIEEYPVFETAEYGKVCNTVMVVFLNQLKNLLTLLKLWQLLSKLSLSF